MWFLPLLSTVTFISLVKLGEALVKIFDQGWLEQYGGQGFIIGARGYSSRVDYFFSLDIKSYLLWFFFIINFYFLYL
jgi:hypothetical protein